MSVGNGIYPSTRQHAGMAHFGIRFTLLLFPAHYIVPFHQLYQKHDNRDNGK